MGLLTPRKAVKVMVLLGFCGFLLVNFQFFTFGRGGPLANPTSQIPDVRIETLPPKPEANLKQPIVNSSNHVQEPVKVVPDNAHPSTQSPKNNTSSLKNKEDSSGGEERRDKEFNESLKFIIKDINEKETIHNIDKFPPNANKNLTYDHVWAVQVHNRDHYLTYLVSSLRTVRDINSSLLIVSHDFYSKEVFDIVASIDFMPVIQIFYPKAMQLYKSEYPGPDPKDCPRDIKKPEALKRGCLNADWPDKYGHYREAPYAQTKLHWFWKLNRIFDGLKIMKNFSGYVTLIEEDHYMTPDALYTLRLMIENKEKLCSRCRIFTLGNYDKKPTYSYTSEVVAATDFISSKHNMAMSMHRETYLLIKQHHTAFCYYDDYNWDWSLQYLSKEVIPGKLPTLIVKTPRVYHIGDCGVHHKGKKCNPEDKAKPIRDRISNSKASLFPRNLKPGKANVYTFITTKKMKANGGWGDKRDHDLCSSFMLDT